MARTRKDFLFVCSISLLILFVSSLLIAHAAQIPLSSYWHWSWTDLGIGVLAAICMFATFCRFTSVRQQAQKIMGESLSQCRWDELIILAIAVGITEELLFRGALEAWMARIHPVFAILIVNLLFGALHAVSLTYGIIAGLLGLILSVLAHWPGEYNLLRPIVAHAVYDYIAFYWIVYEYRRSFTQQ